MIPLLVVLPSWLPESHWNDFLAHRKELKRPVTTQGAKRLLTKLHKLYEQGQDIQAVLDRSMENGWAGVFPLPSEKPAHHTLASRAALAWAEVRAAVRAGRGKVWADVETAPAIAALGGWCALETMRSDQALFLQRMFERQFVMLAKR